MTDDRNAPWQDEDDDGPGGCFGVSIAIAGALLGVLLYGHAQAHQTTASRKPAQPVSVAESNAAQSQAESVASCHGENPPVATAPPPAFALFAQQHGFSLDTIAMIERVEQAHHRDDVDFGALIVALGIPEASGNPGCRCGSYTGLQQWNRRIWAKRIYAAGFDFATEEGRSGYFCQYIGAQLDAGKTLRQALGPWSTKSRALKLYHQMED